MPLLRQLFRYMYIKVTSKLLSLLIQGEESDDVDDDEQAGDEDALDNTIVDSEEVIRSRQAREQTQRKLNNQVY